ncbi:MAG: hypothetical protein ACSHYB_02990 [Roseibacillus sp.]
MSDVISAWVDQDEMRRLAESLLSRPYGHEFNRLEVDFGSQFEGFASGVSSAPELPPTASEKIDDQPAVRSPEPEDVEARSSATSPPGQAPSVVRSAVQFLKKAQAEGRAGGVMRESKEAPPLPTSPPSQNAEVNYSEPARPEPRPIHSPFRRVREVEAEAEAPDQMVQEVAQEEPQTAAAKTPVSRIKRPPVPSAEEPILARVTHFGKWLKGPVGARNYFVSNIEGKILIDEVANPKLIQVARSLAGASGASDGEVGSLHVRIGEESILEVVPTPSQFGTLILGLIVEHPLPEELIREIRLGLEEVANARLIKTQSKEG